MFSFRYNRDPLRAARAPPSTPTHVSIAAALALLAIGTVLTTVQAEILVGALEPALKALGMTELFAGVIVVALVGNAAEHYSAISAAREQPDDAGARDLRRQQRADRADGRAGAGPARRTRSGTPMSLVFNAFEITAIGLSVLAVALVVARRREQLARRAAAARRLPHSRHRLLPHPVPDAPRCLARSGWFVARTPGMVERSCGGGTPGFLEDTLQSRQ